MLADMATAACVGADPRLFDSTTFPGADLALHYCGHCPVVALCLDIVRPSKSHFDGVAGGIVWRNGYKVRSDNSTREDRLVRRNGAA